MSVELLDYDYVREKGSEVHAQLFPRPNEQGEPTLPLPVALNYEPAVEIRLPIMFVPARSVNFIGGIASNVRAETIYVTVADRVFTTDLSFGKEPDVPELEFTTPEESAAVGALLRAVTGTLT